MAEVRQFRQNDPIVHGTTAQDNLKLTDIVPLQHEDLATNVNQMKKISIAQALCEPFAVCNSNNPANGKYVADCVNFPDFALSFTDSQGNSHNLIGLKIRVMFTYGVTYGSVSGGTFPELNINGSGSIPLLAQGKKMGAGAISVGQSMEFTVIPNPFGAGLAFDADSNVLESNSDYTVYTDGSINHGDNPYLEKYFTIPNGDIYVDTGILFNKVIAVIPMGHNDASFTTNYYAWYYSDYGSQSSIVCTNARKIKVIYQRT